MDEGPSEQCVSTRSSPDILPPCPSYSGPWSMVHGPWPVLVFSDYGNSGLGTKDEVGTLTGKLDTHD